LKASGLPTTTIDIPSVKVPLDIEAHFAREMGMTCRSGQVGNQEVDPECLEIPIQRIELVTSSVRELTCNHDRCQVQAIVHPRSAKPQELIWKVTTEKGVASPIAILQLTETGCEVSAKGDGIFVLKCIAMNGKRHPDVISQLTFTCSGLGNLHKSPYAFVSASLYDRAIGAVGAGHDRGVSTDNLEATTLIFDEVAFGEEGSDQLTLEIFAFDPHPQDIELMICEPHDDRPIRIEQVRFDRPAVWGQYQEQTFRLTDRITGLKTLSFVFHTRNHFKGFCFQKQNRIDRLISILDADLCYGDQMTKQDWGYQNIGNNVTFRFSALRFTRAMQHIEICGRSKSDTNTIRLVIRNPNGESHIENLDFAHSDLFVTRSFPLQPIEGVATIDFVFLPGSRFDFKWFRFYE
jgi:beta-galactosidase